MRGFSAARILIHNFRTEEDKEVKYNNKNINPELTHLNTVQYFSEKYKNETGRDTYKRLQDRIKQLDAEHPPKRIRKDRVTLVGFDCPAPDNLPPNREEEFFRIVYEEVAKMCGGEENVSNMAIHRDEVHSYIDASTKQQRTSRVHCHIMGIPYTPEYGVNCKNFMTKESMKNLQQVINDRCMRELGVPFLNGTRESSRADMESLKLASLEAAEEKLRELLGKIAEAQKFLDSINDAINPEDLLNKEIVEILRKEYPEELQKILDIIQGRQYDKTPWEKEETEKEKSKKKEKEKDKDREIGKE